MTDLLERGACGVKLYQGHTTFHVPPLTDPSHQPVFALLARRGTPVLLHVNTVRFRDELVALSRAHPGLNIVCPHLCGSRTDLDRLAGILAEIPGLLVDTSHGPGKPGADGFTRSSQRPRRERRRCQQSLLGVVLVDTTKSHRQRRGPGGRMVAPCPCPPKHK